MVRVSDHVYVIPDGSVFAVPNVGIVVGTRATLVVDTGLGPRNGQTVVREVARVSRNAELYVVSTHFHAEHALGESAFPETAKIVRYRKQQDDIDEFKLSQADMFSRMSPVMHDLLAGATFRRADIIFERDQDFDLGGIQVRILGRGATHTRDDTMIFIEGERILFAGDVVMNKTFLSFSSPYASVRDWLASLDELATVRPARVVPSHGPMGDASLIEQDRVYLTALQARVRELKGQGKSVEETAQALTAQFQGIYPDWASPTRVAGAVKAAYAEAR